MKTRLTRSAAFVFSLQFSAKVTIVAVTLLFRVGPATAQNTWMSGGHPVPLWSNAGAWSLNVVPDGSTDISIPDGMVGGDVSFTNRNTLTIGAPATLTVLSPTTVINSGFSGFVVNGGSMVNNGTLVNASSAALNNGGTLTNNGTLLNEIGAQLNNSGTLDNFGTFDNRVAGFVVNTGNLNNQSGGLLINDPSSTIENDHSIANLAGATLSNSGSINGSGIFVNSGTVDNFGQLSSVVFNLGGTINNTGGGSIRLGDGSDIVGGSLGGPGGNVILAGTGATATLDGSNSIGFGALTIRGTYTSDVGTTTNLLGTINNQGNIQVNSGGQDTNLALIGTTTLQGGGTVTLANNGGGRLSIVSEIGGRQTLINVDNTIQGTGVIDPIFVNQAAGTVNANVSGQMLDLLNGNLTNAGLVEATNGGVLFIKSTDVVNAGGTIEAVNGGIVSLVGGSVQGGLLNNVSGTLGTLAVGNAIELDGSTAAGAVTIRGTYTVDVGSTTILLGTINNQGNIHVNSGGLATHLALMGDTTLQGGGTVTLANNGGGGFSNISENGSTPPTLINADNTIQGTGAVDPILVNQAAGTVNANVSGQLLELLNGKLMNAGLLEATGGGVLFIKNTEAINAGGVIAALNGTVDVESGTLTNAGTVQVNAGSTLLVNAPFTQTGGKTRIDGSMTLTQGENISGGMMLGTGTINGSITMTGGTMHPGGANTPGTLIINGDLAESNALFDIFIGASGNGLLVANGAVTLGDATDLNIDLLDGFKPFDGEMFTIMNFLSGSGIFANAPSTGFEMDGFDWTILYGPNSIVLDAVALVEGGGGGTSVPEPGTGALLLGAIATMFFASLLRKKQPARCA
jgi:DNA-binding IscR family transcriptional regulator